MSLEVQLLDLSARIAQECKSIRGQLNSSIGDLTKLPTAAKSNLVASLTELHGMVMALPAINDAAIAATSLWSSQKTSDSIAAAINALVNGAPEALNTLKELADKLANDETSLGSVITALGFRVRFDEAQVLTAEQQTTARSNIGGASAAEVQTLRDAIGDTEVDLVAAFDEALV